jgi:hypothetical protein
MDEIINGFPKFQFSQFDSKGGQLVVRCNDKEEFENLVGFSIKDFITTEQIAHQLNATEQNSNTSNYAVKPQPVQLGNCDKCGAPNSLSKAGKPYCSAKCWLAGQKSY